MYTSYVTATPEGRLQHATIDILEVNNRAICVMAYDGMKRRYPAYLKDRLYTYKEFLDYHGPLYTPTGCNLALIDELFGNTTDLLKISYECASMGWQLQSFESSSKPIDPGDATVPVKGSVMDQLKELAADNGMSVDSLATSLMFHMQMVNDVVNPIDGKLY